MPRKVKLLLMSYILNYLIPDLCRKCLNVAEVMKIQKKSMMQAFKK